MKTVIIALTALMLFTACGTNRIFRDGKDGESCSVSPLPDDSGALILCKDSSVVVKNGSNVTPVEMIQLCPAVVGGYDNFPEQAIKVGSTLYGVMVHGNKGALVPLYPGSYSTTTPNGDNCNFIVNADGVTLSY